MSAHPPFDPATIEVIAKALGEAGARTDIRRYFQNPEEFGGHASSELQNSTT